MREKHDAASQIGSREFQKRTGRIEHEDRMEQHVKELLMDNNGKLKKDILEHTTCPVCEADNYEELFQRWGFTYVRCNKCSMMYVNPMLNEEMVDFEYETGYEEDWVHMLLNPTQREFDNPKFFNGIKTIEKVIETKGKILDVGCATGHFLEICKERGWDVTGVELTKSAVEHCRKIGLNVIDKKLHEAEFEEKSFDAITLWDALEHIPKPKEILKEVRKLLKDGGVLLVMVPNGGSLAARILQEKCNMFSGFAHINIFNPTTLKRVLLESGFEVKHMETIISEINIINNYLNYEHPYAGNSEEKNNILGFPQLNEKFIHDNLLGYKIISVSKVNPFSSKEKV